MLSTFCARHRFGTTRTWAVVLAMAASTLVVAAPASSPVEAVDFFKIGYSDLSRSYLVNPDGTNNEPYSTAAFTYFDFTPDGTKYVAASGVGSIFLRNQDGRVFNIPVTGTDPELSPDGTRIAYVRSVTNGANVIDIIDLEGEFIATLGPGRQPTWSPDGTKVAFAKVEPTVIGCGHAQGHTLDFTNAEGLAVGSATGGGSSWIIEPIQLKSGSGNGAEYFQVSSDPDWSPDGSQILVHGIEFTAGNDGGGPFGSCVTRTKDTEVYKVPSGGGTPVNLTDDAEYIGGSFTVDPADLNASWSPDGKTIAFASNRNVPRDGGQHSLWTMNPDGSNPQLVLITSRVDETDWMTALPVGNQVSIQAPDRCATEGRRTPGTFTIKRSGVTDGDVPITIKVSSSSTATSGVDFAPISTTITIADGSDLTNVVVVPIDDSAVEGDETITIEIVSAAGGLLVGEPSTATIILDDDDDEITGPCAATAEPPDVTPLAEPGRLLDTRPTGKTVDGKSQAGGRVRGGTEVEVQVTGRGGVESGAGATVLNVTAVNPSERGYLTVYPCGDLPLASSLNYAAAGAVVGNELVAKLSGSGSVCIFSSADTHLTADVVGFVPSDSAYDTLTPARLLDTRPNGTTIDGAAQRGGRVEGGEEIEVQIATRGGVDAGAVAAVLNVTATNPADRGFVTMHPCGDLPLASSLNYASAGAVVANEVVAKLSPEGTVCIFSSVDVELIADVVGFVPAGSDTTSITPARMLDTRPTGETVDGEAQAGGRVLGDTQIEVQIAGRPGVPSSGAAAVIMNVTAVNPSERGFVTLHPCGELPLASSLNYAAAGAVVGNEVIAKLSPQGTVCLYTSADSHLTIDVVGYVSENLPTFSA